MIFLFYILWAPTKRRKQIWAHSKCRKEEIKAWFRITWFFIFFQLFGHANIISCGQLLKSQEIKDCAQRKWRKWKQSREKVSLIETSLRKEKIIGSSSRSNFTSLFLIAIKGFKWRMKMNERNLMAFLVSFFLLFRFLARKQIEREEWKMIKDKKMLSSDSYFIFTSFSLIKI